jgi:GGDEF domain-containing protein/CHASE3 domain sensor protein
MNLTIRQQIFFSYIIMILFVLLIGIYAISSLAELNNITSEMVSNEIILGEKLSKLNDCLLAQDLHEKRSLALGKSDSENMFWNRSREFKSLLVEIGAADGSLGHITKNMNISHERYDSLFARESSLINDGRIEEAQKLSSTEMKDAFNKILLGIKDIDLRVKELLNSHISKSNSLGARALMITIILSVVSFIVGILFASVISRHMTTSLVKLKEATDSIRSGNFDNLPEIKGADELSDLAISFKEMSVRLKELEAINLDANPLTKLPGNLAIEKELLTRLNETQKFSFCLVDLDNFKAFNDRYGFARGSDVIKWIGNVLAEIKKELGTADDFLGHIGGDDFVLICSPERVHELCSRIVQEFDKGIVNFYDPEDLKKGFIVSIDRNDKPAIYGIMTVSIAVVNTDRTVIREAKEVALKVTELKQYAKTFAKSLYIMDRRRTH